MKKKKVTYPIHKMGKNYGYHEFEDGSIQIAPILSDKIYSITTRQQAIDTFLNTITKQCHEMLVQITREYRDFWKQVGEEYGFDLDKYTYTYNGCSGKITRKEKDDHDNDGGSND